MKPLLASVIFYIGIIRGQADLDDTIANVLKIAEELRNCPKATDLVCPRKDIFFWLQTRSTKGNPTKLDPTNLSSAPFVNAPTKVIIHGYMTTIDGEFLVDLRNAYLKKGEYNIISVDWSALCVKDCYYHATNNIPTVAHCVSQFLLAVRDYLHGISMHFVAHSLGVHVATWVSQEMSSVYRITMLDPALPLFRSKSPLVKEAKAEFVDVYHSNAALLGQQKTPATLSVYYNNEMFQPGCGCDVGCSHIRSVEFFTQGIYNPGRMKAFPCAGWEAYREDKCVVPTSTTMIVVGEDVDITSRGDYMMFTDGSPPFLIDPSTLYKKDTFNSYKVKADSSCTPFEIYDILRDFFVN